ncbi:hypothetical protein K469DRAFT_756170 [Zopfia rhizophila CBS 207.26]|uniref:Uncharacterized protein n=1 Tax=Zopfia rhizophila CBS 207.26 TaxID=1314779 RepID=A0A6A6DD65_9PEZI|nr:hypothetical protein K469DRAFT_756170 [Zopfia rhizophila CBS 207.26]
MVTKPNASDHGPWSYLCEQEQAFIKIQVHRAEPLITYNPSYPSMSAVKKHLMDQLKEQGFQYETRDGWNHGRTRDLVVRSVIHMLFHQQHAFIVLNRQPTTATPKDATNTTEGVSSIQSSVYVQLYRTPSSIVPLIPTLTMGGSLNDTSPACSLLQRELAAKDVFLPPQTLQISPLLLLAKTELDGLLAPWGFSVNATVVTDDPEMTLLKAGGQYWTESQGLKSMSVVKSAKPSKPCRIYESPGNEACDAQDQDWGDSCPGTGNKRVLRSMKATKPKVTYEGMDLNSDNSEDRTWSKGTPVIKWCIEPREGRRRYTLRNKKPDVAEDPDDSELSEIEVRPMVQSEMQC